MRDELEDILDESDHPSLGLEEAEKEPTTTQVEPGQSLIVPPRKMQWIRSNHSPLPS